MLKLDPINNKRYMQTTTFWNDPHNKRMAKLSDQHMRNREILELVTKHNRNYKQNIDGSLKQQESKGIFGFMTGPSKFLQDFVEYMNSEYLKIKNTMHQVSKNAFKDFGFKK